jgi:hypothetical protein
VFREALEKEMEIFDQSKSTIRRGSSARGQKIARDVTGGNKAVEEASQLTLMSPLRAALSLLRRKPNLSEAEADEISKLLKAGSIDELKTFETNLEPKYHRRVKRRKRGRKAAIVGAIVGGSMVNPSEEEDDAEE